MVDVLLHIWTASNDFGSNQFLGMDMARITELDQEIIARGNGTMERFFFRLSPPNNSTAIVHLKFFVNSVLKREIIINSVGQTGTFLPSNQLPLSFLKDDRLTLEWTGIVTGFITAEIGFDLKFTT